MHTSKRWSLHNMVADAMTPTIGEDTEAISIYPESSVPID